MDLTQKHLSRYYLKTISVHSYGVTQYKHVGRNIIGNS